MGQIKSFGGRPFAGSPSAQGNAKLVIKEKNTPSQDGPVLVEYRPTGPDINDVEVSTLRVMQTDRDGGQFEVTDPGSTRYGFLIPLELLVQANDGKTFQLSYPSGSTSYPRIVLNDTAKNEVITQGSGAQSSYATMLQVYIRNGSGMDYMAVRNGDGDAIGLLVPVPDFAESQDYVLKISGNSVVWGVGGSGGSSDHKVLVDAADDAPDYLNNKLAALAPIQKKVENNTLIFYQDPVEASPLSVICTPAIDCCTVQANVISGSAQYAQRPAMQLHAFSVPNYYVPEMTDILSFVNTNTQGSQALSILYIALFEYDFEQNVLNLVFVSEDVASSVTAATGMQNAAISEISGAFNIIKPGKLYYTGFVCDQSALTVASGTTASAFNCSYPYLGITFHNLDNATTPEDFFANYATIDLSSQSSINKQEGYTRGAIMLRHHS